jgi:uncharacterized protein (TIGR00369 family)
MTTQVNSEAAPGFGAAFGKVDPDNPDYERLRAIVDKAVPFARHVGIEVTELGPDRAVVEIPNEPHMTNHLRTVHAGALFLAADVAGACAFVGALAPRLSIVDYFVLRDTHVSFRKPAQGRIRAVGSLDQRDVQVVLAATDQQKLEVDGRAVLFDEAGVQLGKVRLDYVVQVNSGER